MLKVSKSLILIAHVLMLSTPVVTICEKKRTCFFEKTVGDYYLYYKSTNCTNSTHFSIYFFYNISTFFQPANIAVVLYGLESEIVYGFEPFKNRSWHSGNLTIAKESMQTNELMQLALSFAILHPNCKTTRYANLGNTHNQFICDIYAPSCSKPLTTTVSSTASSKFVDLKPTTKSFENWTGGESTNNDTYIIIIAALFVAVFLGIVGLVVLCFVRKNWHQLDDSRNADVNNMKKYSSNHKFHIQTCCASVKLFLIFVTDHEKHLNVVKNFANFLQGDLGFQVFCEIFQTLECSEDPITWMDRCFTDADNVLVIWSPNATTRWMQYCKGEAVYQDLFTPVLKHIYNDLFRNQNRGKYYFAIFDYFPRENIPPEFINETCFRLMDQFEDLYYRLKSIEPFLPGGEIKEKKVMTEHYNSLDLNVYGHSLYLAIEEMNRFVSTNPQWNDHPSAIATSINVSINQNEANECILHIEPSPSILSTNNNFLKDNSLKFDAVVRDSCNTFLIGSRKPVLPILHGTVEHEDGSKQMIKENLINMQHTPGISAIKSTAKSVNNNTKLTNEKHRNKKSVRFFLMSPKSNSSFCSDRQIFQQQHLTKVSTNNISSTAVSPSKVLNFHENDIRSEQSETVQHVDECFSDMVLPASMSGPKSLPLPKVTLAPLDLEIDPMRSLLALSNE